MCHRWSEHRRDLGFQRVRLTNLSVSRRFGVTLEVSGHDALNDAPLVSLARQALAYRRTDGAIVKLGEQTRLTRALRLDDVYILIEKVIVF